MLPGFLDVRTFKIVNGKLQLILQPNLAVRYGTPIRADDPGDVIDAVHVLQESGDALQSVGQLDRDGVKIDAAALLEISELGDFETIEHHLPADAPCAQSGRLPVVFLELDVVLAQVDAD